MYSTAYDGNQGGAGGKFRKRPFRKSHTTPYDRPPTALLPPQNLNDNNNSGNGWLSKIVDPASKLITAGAHKLFASVFRKRLLPPPSPPSPQRLEVEVKETEYLQQQMGKNVVTSDTKVPADYRVNNGYMASDSNGVGELEYMLNQKTFTRSEIDHLTALLLSRTVENSDDVDKGRSEPKPSDVQADDSRCDKLSNLPAYETRIDRAQFSTISTPEVRSKVLSDDVASPAEIAKAYMGSRPTNLSPSVVRLQNQLPKEDLSTPSNCLKPVMSLTQRPVSNVGTSSNVFTTPRFRGRSAIYSMARAPCSRIYPATTNKAAEMQFTSGGSSYLDATENNSSKKQVLKRRSFVLENDIGSVGPIRRIRQKPNLLHPKTLSLPPPGVRRAMRVPGLLSDAAEVPSSMEQISQNRAFLKMHAENSTPSTSSGYVPSQSIETAQKILEHLDKYSPKGNVGNKVGTSGGILPTKTPAKITQDSSKPLQSSQDTKKVIGSKETVHARNHQCQTSSMMEDVSATKAVSTSARFGPQDGTEGKKADSYLSSKGKATEYMMPVPVNSHPQKQAFQMSAHEDFLELDDDPSSNDTFSTLLSERTLNAESQKMPVSIPDILPQDQTIVVERPATAETPPPPPPGKSQLESLANGSFDSDTSASCPFPVSLSPPASSTTVLGATTPPLLQERDKVAFQNEASGLFTAPSSKSDNLPPFGFTSPSAAKDSKLETPFSAKRTAAEANGSVNTENSKGTPVFGTTAFEFQDSPPVGDLPNGLKTNDATPVNGVLSAVPSKANESSIAASMSPLTPEAPFKFSDAKPSTSTITAPLPMFTSAFPSPSPSTTVATSSDTAKNSGAKLTTNAAISPFVFTSSTTGPTTTDTFLFQAASPSVSASAPIFSSQSASSVSASVLTSTSIFSAPASTSASIFLGLSAPTVSAPSLTFTSSSLGSTSSPAPSFPSQSAASPSTFIFGSSGSTGPNSSSIFGSSTANPFSSVSGSATTSNGLGMGSSSTSTTTSTIFGFTGEPPKTPPTFGIGSFGATGNSLFGANTNTNSSSASSTSTFVFGGNSTPAAPTPAMTNSPFQSQPAFGSTCTQPFQFGSTPSTNNVQSTMEDTMAEDSSQPSTPPPVFGSPAPTFGATPTPSPFGAPAPPIFGAMPQAPVFGATPPASGGSFGFNATPAAANPFQFNTQQPSQNPVQNSSFQASGSLEFNGGANGGANSFSLGTSGTSDKSQRRIVRVKKTGKRR